MKKTALCIGINHFPPGWCSDLMGCVNDAQDMALALRNRGWEVAVLLDRQATRAEILRLARQVIESAGKDGMWGITLSSHGTQIPDENNDEADGMDEATCCADGALILDDEWWKMFRSKPPWSMGFFFSDSCHSGTVARSTYRPKNIFEHGEVVGARRFVPHRLINPDAWKISGKTRAPLAPRLFEEGAWLKEADGAGRVPWPVLLMSGCQDDEYSYDAVIDGRPCGAFTHTALAALDKMPEAASFNDWFIEIRRALPSKRYPQTPRMIGSYLRHRVLFG